MISASFQVFLLIFINSPAAGFIRFCYFPGWAFNRNSAFARFDVKNVEPDICTHLVYAFGKIDPVTSLLTATNDTHYRLFTAMKSQNSDLKTLLSLGGETDHGDGFVAASKDDAQALRFASQTVAFLREYQFDGLDIDWEYPTGNTSVNFLRLLNSLRKSFDADSRSPKLLLTIAAPVGTFIPYFKNSEIYRLVDYASLMTYDFVDARYSEVTNFNSPLYSRDNPKFNQEFSTNWAVSAYKNIGLPLNKMLVGVTGVGKWLVLNDTSRSEPGSPIVTRSLRNSSDYFVVGGMAYPEICRYIQSHPSSKRVFDDQQKSTYLVQGDNWITYEDQASISEKAKWAKSNGLAGIMMWSLDQDDFSGLGCQQGTYPLMKAVKRITETPRTVTTSQSPNGSSNHQRYNVVYILCTVLVVITLLEFH